MTDLSVSCAYSAWFPLAPFVGLFVVIFFKTIYNKTIIRFGFSAILNNQGLVTCHQPRPVVSADTLTSTLPPDTKTSSNNCLKCLDYQSFTYPKAKRESRYTLADALTLSGLIIQTLSQKKNAQAATVEPRLIGTPRYYGQFSLSLGKALRFYLNSTRLIRTSGNENIAADKQN